MWSLFDSLDIVSVVAEFIFHIFLGDGEGKEEGPYIQTLFSKPE
jgi:hypothetical protein